MMLGAPLKNFLGRPSRDIWSKQDLKDFIQLYVQFHNGAIYFIKKIDFFPDATFTNATMMNNATTGVAEELDFSQIYRDDYDDDSMEYSDVVQDLCANSTILAEVYAFYDNFYGPEGAMQMYFDKYGMGEPSDKSMEVPEGFVDFMLFWFSEWDMAETITVYQKYHSWITDEAADLMNSVCQVADV